MVIRAARRVAALETIQHLPGFGDFPRLIIKNAQSGITTGPLRQKVHGALEVFRGLRSFALQNRNDSQTPQDFPGARNSAEPFPPRTFGTRDPIFPEVEG